MEADASQEREHIACSVHKNWPVVCGKSEAHRFFSKDDARRNSAKRVRLGRQGVTLSILARIRCHGGERASGGDAGGEI